MIDFFKINYFRKRIGMSQKFLAEKSGITPEFLSMVENGKSKISADIFMKIVSVLNIKAEDLLISE